jgi:uncharacterized membrane protein YgcG
MANDNKTIFQRLGTVLRGHSGNNDALERAGMLNSRPAEDVLFQTTDKAAYEKELRALAQEKLLAMQWIKAGMDSADKRIQARSEMHMLYFDCDLMDADSEIHAALDIMSEESCTVGSTGKILNVSSSSDRIKSILEDLFVNRLSINTTLPMISRGMCKYGNDFMLLNINKDEGVLGWRELPVAQMERLENGMTNPYTATVASSMMSGNNPEDVNFMWVGKNEKIPYKNWQVAHFRLMSNSFYLPYGMSVLHGARRAWKMMTMMEDMMLIYRLERSIERRIFKIFVGNLDQADIPSYVQQIANNFKRASVIDPMTGQIDLRKRFMDVSEDYFIPVRTENAPTPIESLPAAQNLTSMDDIEYMKNKVLAALRVPKSFLNFQEAQGKGQNLSIMDIRFSRMINKIQQALLMELNKIAIIHLYILGFTDDLTNFTLSMNNPSSQIESMELENLQKRIQIAQTALQDPGNGIPIFSIHRTLREIMKMSDKEIADNLNEIRLEKGLASELEKTSQIIKRTGIFDPVDNIYGEAGAEYSEGSAEGEGGPEGLGGGGGSFGGGGADFGSDLDALGEPGGDETGDIGGESGTVDMERAPVADAGEVAMESIKLKGKKLLTEVNHHNITEHKRADIYNKNFFINEELNKLIGELNNYSEEVETEEITDIITETIE